MKYIDFEDYLQEQHQVENPTILDDDLPDAYGDWIENLSSDEWIVYGNRFARIHSREVIDNLKI